jgi:hypothetical protein
MIRLFVLLTWHPAIGLPVDPVGVLGIEQSSGGSCRHHVCWLTPGSRTNAGWASRLAAPPDEAAVIRWLDQKARTGSRRSPFPAESTTWSTRSRKQPGS